MVFPSIWYEGCSMVEIETESLTGLNICEGEYVLFLDQDDELLDNALASQLEFITRENADMVICNAYMERKDGSSYSEDFNAC